MAPHRKLCFEPLEQRALLALTVELVAELNPGAAFGVKSRQVVTAGGVAYFNGSDPTRGPELWKTDGTAGGTVLVKDIRPGSGDSNISELTNVNGTLFFVADDGVNGKELWKSDGTAGGTLLVKDIVSGSGSSNPAFLLSANGKVFFRAFDLASKHELWVSDGTPAGTVLLKGNLNEAVPLASDNGIIYFRGNDAANGTELWKSDGTVAGTVLVKDINPGPSSSFLTRATVVNGTLFFPASDGIHGRELWKSDGTAVGTVLVKDILPGTGSGAGLNIAANVNGTLFFDANDSKGSELWKSDGTEAGTVLVKDIWSDGASGIQSPYAMANSNGTVFFSAVDHDNLHDTELWKSDGTAAGTVMVKDIRPGNLASNPSSITAFGNGVLFEAHDGTSSRVWYSDGTDAGTVMVADALGADFADSVFASLNGLALFVGHDDAHGLELRAVRNIATAPIAPGNRLSTVKATPVAVTLTAGDPQNDPLSYRVIEQPLHGTLSGTAPNLTYTPAADYIGPDSFTYRANDGIEDSNLATISIDVIASSPVANDVLLSTMANRAKSVVLAATDPRSLALTYTIVGGPLHGTLTGTAPTLIYTPALDYVGPDSFTYQASNGESTSNKGTVSITVNVNHAPTVPAESPTLIAFSKIPVVLTGEDEDGDPLTFTVLSPPDHGILTGTPPNLSYTPVASVAPSVTLTYQASDGDAVSNVGTITILILNVELLVFAEDGAQTKPNFAQQLYVNVPPGGDPGLAFESTSDKPSLFAEQPEIAPTGTLTFTPAPNAQGTAIVTVVKKTVASGAFEGEGDEFETAEFVIEIVQKAPWQNDGDPNNVNGDKDKDGKEVVAPDDVLLVIDYINGTGTGEITNTSSQGPFYDSDGDNYVSPNDVLCIINWINATDDVVEGEARGLVSAGGGLGRSGSRQGLAGRQVGQPGGQAELDWLNFVARDVARFSSEAATIDGVGQVRRGRT